MVKALQRLGRSFCCIITWQKAKRQRGKRQAKSPFKTALIPPLKQPSQPDRFLKVTPLNNVNNGNYILIGTLEGEIEYS